MSIDYYDRNGARFFADSAYADLARTHSRFLAHVRDGGAILEAGCGSGRDALAFSKAGYAVTAFDGSARMVELARAHSGLPVVHMRFEDVVWHDTFDGIWSCASLLHVARSELPGVMARLADALKPGGAWFMSFKYGTTDRFANERYFTIWTKLWWSTPSASPDLILSTSGFPATPGRAVKANAGQMRLRGRTNNVAPR